MNKNMHENPFGNISPIKENKPLSKKSERKFTRREVLDIGWKTALAGSATLLAEKTFINLDTTKSEDPFSEADQKRIDDAISRILDKENAPTKEQSDIVSQDKNVIGKTFYEQLLVSETIVLDKPTKKAIYAAWHKRYSPGGTEYKGGLIKGLERMEPWVAEIKTIFKDYDIPEKYIYLAIPESHFDVDAVSHANDPAIGTYQITSHTAKLYDMQIDDNYDRRRDPIKSATLCAQHLQDSYKRFNKDWSLALMDYNGGFTNDYLEHIKESEKTIPIEIRKNEDNSTITDTLSEGETLSDIALRHGTSIKLLMRANGIEKDEIHKLSIGRILRIPQKRDLSLDSFNNWLEDQINDTISNEPPYKVKAGETLSKISKNHNVSMEELQKLNHLTSNVLQIGQKLRIPSSQSPKFIITKKLQSIAKFSENINYPEKFNAIFDIIDSENLSSQFENALTKYKEIDTPKTNMTKFSYEVRGGDTLGAIIRKLKKQYPGCEKINKNLQSKLVQNNNLRDAGSIRLGQILNLELMLERPATLIDISKKYKVKIEKLTTLNPAVMQMNMPLPEDIQIRIPIS